VTALAAPFLPQSQESTSEFRLGHLSGWLHFVGEIDIIEP
jgi:hypothetical protein